MSLHVDHEAARDIARAIIAEGQTAVRTERVGLKRLLLAEAYLDMWDRVHCGTKESSDPVGVLKPR